MNKETKLGDGVANEVKEEINRELSSTAKTLIRILFAYLNNKVQGIDIDDILGKLSKKDEDEIISLWSSQLVEEGLLPSGYGGLPNDLLIDNLHQTGYVDGLYSGYVLAMISLIDNNAPHELIASVKDDLFPKPIALRYRDRHELVARLDERNIVGSNARQRMAQLIKDLDPAFPFYAWGPNEDQVQLKKRLLICDANNWTTLLPAGLVIEWE